jgi:hypothetical protein
VLNKKGESGIEGVLCEVQGKEGNEQPEAG